MKAGEIKTTEIEIKTGTIHNITAELEEILIVDSVLLEKWNSLTDLARNEWLCYITIAKKAETRKSRLERLCNDIKQGSRLLKKD